MIPAAAILPTATHEGDSITHGDDDEWSSPPGSFRQPLWIAAEADGLPYATVGNIYEGGPWVYNRHNGYDGQTAATARDQIPGRVGLFGPDLSTLLIGTNDNDDAATVAGYISDCLDALFHCNTKPWFRVGLFTLLRRRDAKNANVLAINALLAGMVAAKAYKARVSIIDVYNSVPDLSYGDTGGGPGSDLVHPAHAGYLLMAAAAYPAWKLLLQAVIADIRARL